MTKCKRFSVLLDGRVEPGHDNEDHGNFFTRTFMRGDTVSPFIEAGR
jgi:hypothetical protein